MRLDHHAEISRRVATTGHPFPDECANVIVSKLPEKAVEAILNPPENTDEACPGPYHAFDADAVEGDPCDCGGTVW